jgi:CHRD domain
VKRLALAVVLAAGLLPPAALGAATVLKSRLTGAQIVNDDGGAPRGVAQATLSLNEPRQRLCFEIAYSGLGGKATAGYLREGGPGELARPAVTLFSEAAASPVSGCVAEVPMKTLSGLRRHPAGHYVDLATRRLPKGAVRGQLHSGAGIGATLEGPSSGGVSRP